MNQTTLENLYIAIISIVILGSILFFILRYIVISSSVQKKSELLIELKKLNDKYICLFQVFQRKIKIDYICNSLQQYKNNCNRISVTNYLCGRMGENEETWNQLYNKANSNKNIYEKYLNECKIIKNIHGKKSYADIKKITFCFSENQYIDLEEKFYRKEILVPQTSLYIVVTISYTSPAGRNHYASEYKFINENVDELFNKMADRKQAERSIAYQRSLMTCSKRYDILRRDHYKCQICGRSKNEGAKLEVDHIIPLSKGGKTIDANLQTLCHECNQGKKAKL